MFLGEDFFKMCIEVRIYKEWFVEMFNCEVCFMCVWFYVFEFVN